MTVNIFLTCLIKVLGSALATIIITYASILFAKLKGKIKDSRIKSYIKEVVRAAEQIYPNMGTKRGTEKYKYVVERTIEKFPFLSDNEYLKSLIEGAVFTLTKHLDSIENKVANTTTTANLSSF